MKVAVIVHPGARIPRIEASPGNALHVYVRDPARKGQANRAVAEALAAHFHAAKGRVTLLSGATSRVKRFEIVET